MLDLDKYHDEMGGKTKAEIDSCQTVEEVRKIWKEKWSLCDNHVAANMSFFCRYRIKELEGQL